MGKISKQQLERIAQALEDESMDLQNFSANDSPLGFDSDFNFDQDWNEYGHAYTGNNTVAAAGQTTFDLTITSVGGAVSTDITLFQSYFNTGTFVAGDLVFVNGANTVTVHGTTSTMQALMSQNTNSPFRINFVRMLPTTAAQLAEQMYFQKNSVFGGFQYNNLSPNTYIDPNQYQPLRVDVPTNFIVDSQKGIKWKILNGESILVTLFIDQVLDPTKELQGRDSVRNLRQDGITGQPIRVLQTRNPIMAGQVAPGMARAMSLNAGRPATIPGL